MLCPWVQEGTRETVSSQPCPDPASSRPISIRGAGSGLYFSAEDTGTLGARILPVSELFCDVDPYPAFWTSVWRNGSDLKALSCSEGPGEPASGPPPPLTCREMRSTSHSSSHSWATADMATTVATRMATSPIYRGRATRRSGGARAWTAQGSPVCGGGRAEVERQREGPRHGWGEWGVRERPTWQGSERRRQEEAGGRARRRRDRRVERRQVGWAGDMAPGLRVWRGKTLSKRGLPVPSRSHSRPCPPSQPPFTLRDG